MKSGFLILACALLAFPALVHAKRDCPPVANAKAVVKPGARLLFGEIHGNAETPSFMGALACHAGKRAPVRVGLEIPADEQSRIDAYLASSDRAGLLQGPFWTDTYQDGRRSEAVVALLTELSEQKRAGADVKVVAFDEPGHAQGDQRDQAMATRLLSAFTAEPKATFLVLTGNLHARKTPGTFKQAFMAGHLADKGAPITSFEVRYSHGNSWLCRNDKPESCRPVNIGKEGPMKPGIRLERSADGAYDGRVEIVAPRFSPPAAIAPTANQKMHGELVQLLYQAEIDYANKRYDKCAEKYLVLALRNVGARAVTSYNAACCHALAGDRDGAFAALTQAVSSGYSKVDGMKRDKDLAGLRKDPRWAALVEQAQKSVGARARSPRNEALRKTLVQMYKDDQDESQQSYARADVPSHRQQRQDQLKNIIAEFGWPGLSLVGQDGAASAWIIAQHADNEVEFQRRCLTLLEEAYRKGDAPGAYLAYLTDRVLINEKTPQVYGTQGAAVYSEAEAVIVNERRKKLGLPSMADVAREKGRFYEQAYREAAAQRPKEDHEVNLASRADEFLS